MAMRLYLSLFFLGFILPVSIALAQSKDPGDDVYNTSKLKPVPTVEKVSIIDDMDFSINEFVKGYIIWQPNSIQNGLLRFNGTTVIFKDTLTQKTKRYNANEINGFVVQVDTDAIHTISKAMIPGLLNNSAEVKINYNNKIPVDTFRVYVDSFVFKPIGGHSATTERIVHKFKFVKQLLYGQKVCLYKITEKINNPGTMNGRVTMGGSSYQKNIFYFKRKNEPYTEIPTGKRAFKKMMSTYIKDNDKLILAINNDRYDFNDLEQITVMYNQN